MPKPNQTAIVSQLTHSPRVYKKVTHMWSYGLEDLLLVLYMNVAFYSLRYSISVRFFPHQYNFKDVLFYLDFLMIFIPFDKLYFHPLAVFVLVEMT